MKIECNNCHKEYDIPDERLPEGEKVVFPCPTCKETIELVRGGKAAGEILSGDALKKQILRKVTQLPPMPQTVMKARKIMSQPNSSFNELAKVLETDQAIASKVIKLANSPYYGMMGKVSSIHHASVVVGMKELGDLIAMAGSSEVLSNELEGYGLSAGDLWQHSLEVAFASKIIAKKKRPALAEDAFTAGLMHDAGKLALNEAIKERSDVFEQVMEDGEKTFLAAEKEILGFDHGEIAAELCRSWNVPDILSDAIRYHHFPSQSNDNDIAYIIHIADALGMMAGVGAGIDGMSYETDDKAIEVIGLSEDDYPSIMEEMVESVEGIAS